MSPFKFEPGDRVVLTDGEDGGVSAPGMIERVDHREGVADPYLLTLDSARDRELLALDDWELERDALFSACEKELKPLTEDTRWWILLDHEEAGIFGWTGEGWSDDPAFCKRHTLEERVATELPVVGKSEVYWKLAK